LSGKGGEKAKAEAKAKKKAKAGVKVKAKAKFWWYSHMLLHDSGKIHQSWYSNE